MLQFYTTLCRRYDPNFMMEKRSMREISTLPKVTEWQN